MLGYNKETHYKATSIIPIEVKEDAEELAEANDRSLSSQIAYWIKEAVKKEKRHKGK